MSIARAERYGGAFRRLLCSAERLREAAIFFGSDQVNTPCVTSSALLSFVARPDHLASALRCVAGLPVFAFFRRIVIAPVPPCDSIENALCRQSVRSGWCHRAK